MAFGRRKPQVPGAETIVEQAQDEEVQASAEPEKPEPTPVEQQASGARSMKYADAMAALEKGRLTRSVLTEKGWVVPPVMPNDRRFARE